MILLLSLDYSFAGKVGYQEVATVYHNDDQGCDEDCKSHTVGYEDLKYFAGSL